MKTALWAAIFLLSALTGCRTTPEQTAPLSVRMAPTNYHGWPDSWAIRNSSVEAVIVPAIGRVMSFRFLDGENVFWEDCSLDGKFGDPTGKDWVNFGGDKTWPAPEAEWGKFTGYKEWMPPPAFDALPTRARLEEDAVILSSPVDPFYGIRTHRRVRLHETEPIMEIETVYERVSGEPAKIGIWVITQFKDPTGVFVPRLVGSIFTNGYYAFDNKPWKQLRERPQVIALTRDPGASHKMGSDADEALWVGRQAMCLVVSTRTPGAEYPDRGASVEVYTNPDPKKYVELETLGPLSVMGPGDRISRVNTYRLMRR